MKKQDRRRLIVARLPVIRGYALPPFRTLVDPDEAPQPPRIPFQNFIHITVGQHLKEMPKKWVSLPDEKQQRPLVGTKRRRGVSALTTISRGEVKLKKVGR